MNTRFHLSPSGAVRLRLAGLTALTLALSGCSEPSRLDSPPADRSVRSAATPRPPVVLISIDTLRSDRLPIYGYAGGETPAIDALRRDAVLFERAYCHTPLTLPSHVSILSGRLPEDHGVRDNQGYRVDAAAFPYLPRQLKSQGYATGAAVSAFVLRGASGLEATGFDVYEDRIPRRDDIALGGIARSGLATLDAIEPWLRSVAGGPFFLFFHTFEPHLPHDPPDASRWASAYDGEVAAADRVVGRLLDLLRELGRYDDALIVLLSDHGEGLGDHGEQEHGIFLYREALQVPLVVKLPGSRRAGTSVGVAAQLIDVYPTILELLDVPLPQGLPGRSLLGLSADSAPRRIYAETFYPRLHYGWSDLASVIEGDDHYIDGPAPELFDLAADPAQTRNLLRDKRRRAAELRRYLAAHDRSLETPSAVDRETRDRLAALGYLGGAVAEPGGPLPDPKAQLPTLDDLLRAGAHRARGELEAAVPLYEKVLAANPRMLDSWQTLGDVQRQLGRWDQALAAYLRAFEISGGDPQLGQQVAASYERVALTHLQQRRWAAARDASRRAVDLDPRRPDAWNNLGVALYQLGQRTEALDAWERAVTLDPGQLDTLYNLGTRAAELGRREQARRALESFIEQASPERHRDELRQARVLLRRLG